MKRKPLIDIDTWAIKKIGVIGPGIVGMPMAAMLANAYIRIGTQEPAKVIVVQRDSENSGWKVDAINSGLSVIGGIEPELGRITHEAVEAGILSASSDFSALSDADVILVSVQTDKNGFEPDYGPLFGALNQLGEALKNRPDSNIPLIIFESTLAPTTMDTLIREHFRKYGLVEGRDILLGNSPNRVMPGRLVERIRESDKLAGGLQPETPSLIAKLYKHIVTHGQVFETNSLTAEIVKTLENAYRDVRIAFSSEIARYCDRQNIDFYQVREKVNHMLLQSDTASTDPNAVPSGGMLIPQLGVGGHCLPKDGILLWWRNIERNSDTRHSLILKSRAINDASPLHTFQNAEKSFGSLLGKRIALLGVAYRFNSEDTRNSPTLVLANHLRKEGYNYIMHDPYVKVTDQNLLKYEQENSFTRDLAKALMDVDYIFMCTSHKEYVDQAEKIIDSGESLKGVVDACNIYNAQHFENRKVAYTGIGRGENTPDEDFVSFVYDSFKVMETGIGNEVSYLIDFYNSNYAYDEFNKVRFSEVQRLARTCSTGCEISDPGIVSEVPETNGFHSELVQCAFMFRARGK
jgi:UDP-N-acetyl-D-mannosaminuronic acid dehydrogenase